MCDVVCVFAAVQSGPLSVVQRCLSDGVRVRVWVRHCAGVRGECWGKLLAFDKHLNLVGMIRSSTAVATSPCIVPVTCAMCVCVCVCVCVCAGVGRCAGGVLSIQDCG